VEYIPPLGGAAGDPYLNPNPILGTKGSIIPAAAFEHPQRELVHLLQFCGLVPDPNNLTQVRQAIQLLVALGLLNYSGTIAQLQLSAAQMVSGVVALPRLPVGLTPRNHLVNGAMQVWQRGISHAVDATAKYTADRWASINASAGTGSTVSLQAFDGEFLTCLRLQRNAGSSNTGQRILCQVLTSEDSKQLAGRTITLSFYARCGANFSAASNYLNSGLRYGTGTDQSMNSFLFSTWTGVADLPQVNHPLSPLTQRFSRTFTVPGNATQLGIFLTFNPTGTAGAADYAEVTGVQLHPGDVALDFPHQRVADEMLECQRFYTNTFNHLTTPAQNKGFSGAIAGVGNPSANRDVNVNWFYPAEMRAVPTITTYNPGPNANGWWRKEDNSSDEESEILNVGRRACSIASLNVGEAVRVFIHAAANAEL
jgi:hypothetical protein